MTSPTIDQFTVGDFRNLMDLRACTTPDTLREAWLVLDAHERATIRWDPRLAAHAERVLAGTRSVMGGPGMAAAANLTRESHPSEGEATA